MVPKSAGLVPHTIFRVDIEIFHFSYRCIWVQVVTSKNLEIFTPTISVLSRRGKVPKVRDKYRRTLLGRKMDSFSLPVGVFRYMWSPRKTQKFRTLFFRSLFGDIRVQKCGISTAGPENAGKWSVSRYYQVYLGACGRLEKLRNSGLYFFGHFLGILGSKSAGLVPPDPKTPGNGRFLVTIRCIQVHVVASKNLEIPDFIFSVTFWG